AISAPPNTARLTRLGQLWTWETTGRMPRLTEGPEMATRPNRKGIAQPKRLRHRILLLTFLLLLWSAGFTTAEGPSVGSIPSAASTRIAQVLAERRIDSSATWPGGATRGLRDIFRETVDAVPLIITQDTIGSS